MKNPPLVIDTNIVLDLFVFDDAAAKPLKAALERGEWQWVATQPMRDELERVLGYAQIVSRLAFYQLQSSDVLASFDRHARIVDVSPKAAAVCSDADDQKFVDLAVEHQALLLSKDADVLSMKKRLGLLGVIPFAALPSATTQTDQHAPSASTS